jgi:RHS repeat-associated protein
MRHRPFAFIILLTALTFGFASGVKAFSKNQVGNLIVRHGGTNFYTAGGFNALEQLTGVIFGNGVGTTLSYYSVSRRLQQIVTAKSSNIQNLTYNYDADDNVTAVGDGVYLGSASAAISSASYSDLNQLISAAWSGYGTKNYGYSSIGNVLTNGEFGGGAYNYGTDGIRPHFVRSANGMWFTCDLNGNTVFRGGQRLDYDVNNHLNHVIGTNGIITTFGSDSDGARLWKLTGTNSLQVWIDGDYEEKNGQILFHILADGKEVCTFDKTGTNVFEYYHPDNLNSTAIQTDQNGNEIQNYGYSPFGQSRYTQSSTVFKVSRRYTGQVLDEDTGLYYYNARYYDPLLARFTQPDDIISDLSDPQTYNRYAYCVDNPLRYTDPSGHEDVLTGASGRELLQDEDPDAHAVVESAKQSAGTIASVGRAVAEANPIVGVADGAYEARTSKDAIGGQKLTGEQRGISGVTAAVSMIPGGSEVGAEASILKNAVRGREAEAKVLKEMGLVKNTEKVSTAEGNAIPDALTSKTSLEVKDSAVVNRTKQIRIQTDAAKASERESVLVTGAKTQVSAPAQKSFDKIIRRDDLGPQK